MRKNLGSPASLVSALAFVNRLKDVTRGWKETDFPAFQVTRGREIKSRTVEEVFRILRTDAYAQEYPNPAAFLAAGFNAKDPGPGDFVRLLIAARVVKGKGGKIAPEEMAAILSACRVPQDMVPDVLGWAAENAVISHSEHGDGPCEGEILGAALDEIAPKSAPPLSLVKSDTEAFNGASMDDILGDSDEDPDSDFPPARLN